jgi:hypothetical protein
MDDDFSSLSDTLFRDGFSDTGGATGHENNFVQKTHGVVERIGSPIV